MFAAPTSWRQRDEADRRVVQGVEHGEVALAGHAECDVDAVDDELVDEELPAGPQRQERAGARGRRSAVCSFGLLLVGGVDVADRPLARPLGGQQQHADERRRLGAATQSASTGSGPDSNQAPPGPYDAVSALGVESSSPVEEVADPGPGMGVGVGDAAGREVDAVAAQRSSRRTGRARLGCERSAPSASSSPSSSCQTSAWPSIVGGAEVRRVVRDVVDDALPAAPSRRRSVNS